MNAKEIGEKLVAFCKEGKNVESINTLYAEDVVSVEAGGPPGQDPKTEGREGVLGKNKWWFDNHEVHSSEVEGPFPHGDRFAVIFRYDITQKASGQRVKMDEVGLFTVVDGKVKKEEFFYSMG